MEKRTALCVTILILLMTTASNAADIALAVTSKGVIYKEYKDVSLMDLGHALRRIQTEEPEIAINITAANNLSGSVGALAGLLQLLHDTKIKNITIHTVEGEPLNATTELKLALDKVAYQIGDSMELSVSLLNHGQASLPYRELDIDRQSISLHVRTGAMKAPGTWTRLHGNWGRNGFLPQEYNNKTLNEGQEDTFKIAVPALQSGTWEWSAEYAGLENGTVLASAVQVVEIKSTGKSDKAVVALETTKGTLYTELLVEETPGTALNFGHSVLLGKYDGLSFHRIIAGFMIQGGDPKGNGTGDFGYSIPFEQPTTSHTPGVLSMARSQSKDSAGSQFFLMHKTSPHLDNEYCAFGRTVQGQEVVDALAAVQTSSRDNRPLETQKIIKASILAWPQE